MNSIVVRIAIIILSFNLHIPAYANVLSKLNNSSEPVKIELNQPTELNFLSAQDILFKREKLVQQNRSLLVDTYKPSPYIFQNIEDHKPWWGMHGSFIWGTGTRSIEGPAEESRFILNPFLLVGVNSGTALIWQTDKINEDDLKSPDFPLCWSPSALIYFPNLSVAQVTYSVSNFNKQLKLHQDKLRFNPDRIKLNQFGLIAYNARDFGFQYMYVDIGKCINTVNINGSFKPVLIKQLIHCGHSSKYPGGCNNMSPAMPEIDRFAITGLPARACIHLWKNQPSSVVEKPDFTFYMDFR